MICAIELLNLLEGVAQILGDKNPLLTWNRYGGMKKRQSVMLVESWGGVQDEAIMGNRIGLVFHYVRWRSLNCVYMGNDMMDGGSIVLFISLVIWVSVWWSLE